VLTPTPRYRWARRTHERLSGRWGGVGCADDLTILQQNGRSSELPFCCKRGHSAILPSNQFLPRACSPRCSSSLLNLWRRVASVDAAGSELHAMNVARQACRGVGGQKPPCMRSIPSPHSPVPAGELDSGRGGSTPSGDLRLEPLPAASTKTIPPPPPIVHPASAGKNRRAPLPQLEG
jgi:hypothetical protein